MPLDEYQEVLLKRALTRNERGHYPYSLILWSDVKKSAKSTVAAAVALWQAWNTPWGSIKIIANDLKQADSRVSYYIRRAIELHPEMREIVKMRPSGYLITFPNHAKIEAVPVDPKGEAGGNDDGVYFCLDQETEVLTYAGWQGYRDLKAGDIIATQNPITREFEWQKARAVFCEVYNGEMMGAKTERFDMLVTPDHRLYGRRKNNHAKIGFRLARDAYGKGEFYPIDKSEGWKGWIPNGRVNGGIMVFEDGVNGDPEVIIPGTKRPKKDKKEEMPLFVSLKDFCRFLGWQLSEGCIMRDKIRVKEGEPKVLRPMGICIGQSAEKNPDKRAEILDLLTRMGLQPHEWSVGMGIACYHAGMGEYCDQFGLSRQKYIPTWLKNLPSEYLEVFLDAYFKGDGNRAKLGKGLYIATNSPKMRDDLIEIGQKLGYSCRYWKYADPRWRDNPVVYTVKFLPKLENRDTQVSRKKWYKTQYSGYVFCPSTDNGIIYVRRNGSCYWTGNSELWGAQNEAAQRLWTELTLSPTKFGISFRWVETYAGYRGESPLLETLYEQGTKEGILIPESKDFNPPLEAWENKTGRMLCLWNTVGRRPWLNQEYYAQEAAVLAPEEFDRVHRNQWQSSVERFIPIEWWDSCQADPGFKEPVYTKDQPHILSLDASVSGDCFAVVMVSGYDELGLKLCVRYVNAYRPPKGGKIDFGEIEKEVRRLTHDYNIIEIVYDPYQLEDMAGRLKKDMLAHLFAFNQNAPRLIADKELQDSIRNRSIVHHGESVLREHLENANAKKQDDHKLRIVKRSELLKIDAAVALSMGLNRAKFWRL